MADLKPPISGYSLWFETSGADAELLQSLIDTLASTHKTRRFTAHATLIGLLDKTEKELAQIQEACEQLAKQQPFSCELLGVGSRDMYFQSVFISCVPSVEMVQLNQTARQLLGHETDPPYMPHWSLVYGDLDQDTKHQITREVTSQLSFPKTVTIDAITLVDVTGYPDDWHTVERYKL